jgi:hypothetical protein
MARSVRILKDHDHSHDEEWNGYHEWVDRADGPNDCEILTLNGAGGNARGQYIRWDYWRCNNSDCDALALVSAVAVEAVVQEMIATAPVPRSARSTGDVR